MLAIAIGTLHLVVAHAVLYTHMLTQQHLEANEEAGAVSGQQDASAHKAVHVALMRTRSVQASTLRPGTQ